MVRSCHIIATPPGATIKEQIDDRGMTQKELASRMEMSEKHISNLINGEVHLTPEVAMKLEFVLGVPASYWNNLEAIYREKLQKVEEENCMDEDSEIVKKFPYSEMSKFGWIENTQKKAERVFALRKFFEVTRLSLVLDDQISGIAYRRLSETEKGDYALLAWAQKAKIEARYRETSLIDVQNLNQILPEIRKMTIDSPSDFCPRLTSLLADCGIAIVFLPHIGGSFLHGASFLDNKKIIVGLTVRGKDADKFWFSLFHELGHVILGHIFNDRTTTMEEENEADAFARDNLISMSDYNSFVQEYHGRYTDQAIKLFAQKIGIDTGIVVGRLQKQGEIDFSWFNHLKSRYSLYPPNNTPPIN